MNKIYKVIYSKVRQCYVVVSEIARSHGKGAKSEHAVKGNSYSRQLAVAVALAISCGGLLYPTQAEADASTNDYFTAYDKNYFDKNGNRSKDWSSVKEITNSANAIYGSVGAKGIGAIAAGTFAQAGQQTITIGNRNAGYSMGSVYIGEYKGYLTPGTGSIPQGFGNNYVTSVGFMSNATKYGTIAIGANASAEGEENNIDFGTKDSSGTYTKSIPENPTITGASVALGYSATAKAGNIAIGAYSEATEATAANKKTAYTGNDAESSYVSVGNSTKQRRISNVADGADVTDAATVGQLQALEKKTIAYNEGWGIKIGDYTKKDAAGNETTVKNAISVDRNLGSNEITTKSKNTFKAAGENSLILGGAGTDDLVYINGIPRETQFGAYGKDSVLVGGENNKITDAGTYAVISGGGQNIASGEHSFIGGGWWNTASGATSAVLGGQSNTASGNQSTIVGGENHRAIGNESTILGGFQHIAIGDHSTISGGDGAYTFAHILLFLVGREI